MWLPPTYGKVKYEEMDTESRRVVDEFLGKEHYDKVMVNPDNYIIDAKSGNFLMAANKSGVSTKQGLVYTAEIVDSDYSGEVHLGIANFTDEATIIRTGQKLVQFIHTPIILSKPNLISAKEFEEYHSESKRGEKGFGSNVSQ
jgi:dUTPase